MATVRDDPRPFERGEVVRPNAEAIALTAFSETSRLTVRRCNSHRWCAACRARSRVQVREERDIVGKPVYAHQLRNAAYGRDNDIEHGALYGAGAELSSSLCLDHVEHV